MNLLADVGVHARRVRIAFEVPAGTTTALLGPNGSGKSTVLGAIAGIVALDAGSVVVGGDVLSAPSRTVPAHHRGTALLAQDPRLFPRMSVLANVAFPARARGLSRAQSQGLARMLLTQVHAGDLAARRPHELSGGQAQRVALARALAAEPAVLLLDEPLAALDQPVAARIRQTLHEVLEGRTSVLVTHDVLDAALLADRLVVVDSGRVIEAGSTSDILARPRTAFTAGLCGLNLLRGTAVAPDRIRTPLGDVVGRGPVQPGTAAAAAFRPGSVAVYREDPGGSPRNAFAGHVATLHPHGDVVRLRTAEVAADLTAAAVAALQLRPGDPVVLTVKATEVDLYAA